MVNCFENIPAFYFYKGLLKVKVRGCRGPKHKLLINVWEIKVF